MSAGHKPRFKFVWFSGCQFLTSTFSTVRWSNWNEKLYFWITTVDMSVLILGLLMLNDADIFISILYVEKKEKRRLSKVNQLTQPYTASMAELDTNICLPDFRVCVSFLSPYTSLHALNCFWLSSEIVWFFSQGTQSSHMKVPYLPTSAKWKRRKCFHLLPNSGILNNKQLKSPVRRVAFPNMWKWLPVSAIDSYPEYFKFPMLQGSRKRQSIFRLSPLASMLTDMVTSK